MEMHHSLQRFHATAGLESAILNSGRNKKILEIELGLSGGTLARACQRKRSISRSVATSLSATLDRPFETLFVPTPQYARAIAAAERGVFIPDGSEADRFWVYVDRRDANECWPFMASRNARGYGVAGYKGKRTLASRVAYILTHGDPQPGNHVLHSCDNPPCCNPHHLREGTHMENMHDIPIEKLVNAGAKLDPDSVVLIKDALRMGETQTSIASRFNVSRGAIGHIAQGLTWKHI